MDGAAVRGSIATGSAGTATSLHELTAVEQRAALRMRAVSSVELTEHYLERIDRLGGDLGAFVLRTPELALREAREADRRLTDGDTSSTPLLGLPIAFKDLQPIAGVPVTNGSIAVPRLTSPHDAAAVGLIRQAGAVTLGTTQAPEFGIPCYTDSHVVGRPAVTPYDVTRSASGSSGGAAAAVAAGLIPIGHGSDGAGSIRTPASVCGLVGVKPSRGVVSALPAASFFGFTTDGPIARTVADAAILLDSMSVRRPHGLYETAAANDSASFLAAANREPRRPLRVAVWTDSGFGGLDPENRVAIHRISRLLDDLGHEVVEISNPAPWDDTSAEAFFDYIGGVVASMLTGLPHEQSRMLAEDTGWMNERGQSLTSADFVRSTNLLAALSNRLITGIASFDLALTPVAAGPAVPLGSFHRGETDAPRLMLEWSAYTPLQNMTGLPAISVPSHVTADGLPLGVQITGSSIGADATLLSLAAQLEVAIGWTHRHPPVWAA